MTRRERLERKLQKRQEWADGRLAKASASLSSATSVPLPSGGEPIKVGHHSEKRHRNAIAKVDALMRKSHEHGQMAKHHQSKAEGLASQLDGSIFSDDVDAVQQLEARIQERIDEREKRKEANKIIRSAPKYQRTDEKEKKLIDIGFSKESLPGLFGQSPCRTVGFPSYSLQNIGANIRRDQKRLEQIKLQQARAGKARQSGGTMVDRKGDYAVITFSEKPERSILTELKGAGFRWAKGSWIGKAADIPECVAAA